METREKGVMQLSGEEPSRRRARRMPRRRGGEDVRRPRGQSTGSQRDRDWSERQLSVAPRDFVGQVKEFQFSSEEGGEPLEVCG